MNLTKKRDAALLREPPPASSSSFDRVWLEAPHSTPSFLAEAKSRKILLCHEKDSVTDTVLPLPRFPVVDPACHIDSNRYAEIVPICYDTISQNQGKSSSDGEL
jgi:hypothetical protein